MAKDIFSQWLNNLDFEFWSTGQHKAVHTVFFEMWAKGEAILLDVRAAQEGVAFAYLQTQGFDNVRILKATYAELMAELLPGKLRKLLPNKA
jgi:hypothetical protein